MFSGTSANGEKMKVSGTSASILWRIARTKRDEIGILKSMAGEFKSRLTSVPKPLDFMKAISSPAGLSVIAEIKKASPSSGIIADEFNPAVIARSYREAGADAVSVLTDVEYFKGAIDYLCEAKRELGPIPVIRKDFILDEVQVYESRAAGADSFLLIVAMLEPARLKGLIALGRSLGMEPLVESHDEEDLERAVNAGARIFGFNNRNLNDFSIDLTVSHRLVKALPEGSLAISESGIKSPDDAKKVFKAGCKGVLVGESLMRDGPFDCRARLNSFKEACLQ
jgi:indole-3-glycerol phosphate synthase